ncbi:MAG: right-handed parallel beta-helix repeat-containing protein, partial [Acidimicrobiia bacterium]
RGNTVSGNGFFREAARRGSGIIVFNRSQRITVVGNTVTGNADNGISVRGPHPTIATIPGATNNVVRDNTAVGNVVLPTIVHPVFGPAFDLHDGNPGCDANAWFGNTYGTASQECVTTGGRQA